MCLIAFSYRQLPNYPLIVAANRDEFYERPTATADYWRESPNILAGRDLKGGGTWLGITRTGKFAALSNYRDPKSYVRGAPSRGELVSGFLSSNEGCESFLEKLEATADRYNGFNLLVGEFKSLPKLFYFSNLRKKIEEVSPGIHGLSNAFLDTPWPKVRKSAMALDELLKKDVDDEKIFDLLEDQTQASDAELPETGVGVAVERFLSSAFISTPDYGTRASTVVIFEKNSRVKFLENSFVGGQTISNHYMFDF